MEQPAAPRAWGSTDEWVVAPLPAARSRVGACWEQPQGQLLAQRSCIPLSNLRRLLVATLTLATAWPEGR